MQKLEQNEGGGQLDTRKRLLDAAGPVFAKHGFDRSTVREICAVAGVNIASVGYYFGDKQGLYREVIQGIRDARESRFPTPDNDPSDPERNLLSIVRALLARMLSCESSDWQFQLLLREMHDPTPVFDSIVRECFRPLYDNLTATLRQLAGEKASKPMIDQLALSVLGQCSYYRFGAGVVQILVSEQERKAHYDLESLARHITSVMLAATQNGAVVEQRLIVDRQQE